MILNQFADTPQIKAALDAIGVLLVEPEMFTAGAASGKLRDERLPRLTWSRIGHHIRRVVADGLAEREALERIMGVWLFHFHHSRTLPDDDRLTHALAESIFGSRPYRKRYVPSKRTRKGHTTRPKRPGRPVMLGLGMAIRVRFGTFLVGLTDYIKRRDTETWKQADAMREPFPND
ncbi:hypothetical protein HED60_02745 [Planctomycetales bacterium ZRK34]|nr:hypothetical protein HED60_02745 [Planctomycetales bacterium ZRK34]